MSSENNNNNLWTRARGESKTKSEPILIGRKISPEWLKESVPVMEVRLSNDLMSALSDLQEAARIICKKLPVRSLRVALLGVIDRVVSIDQDLGLGRNFNAPAIVIMQPAPEEYGSVRTEIMRQLKLWVMNTVEPWAEHNGFGNIAARIKLLIVKEAIELSNGGCSLIDKSGTPNFSLIARVIGEKLIGERLFHGLSECELVAFQGKPTNTIELMTLPSTDPRGDKVYSMVCRLTVCTMPYNNDVYLGMSAMKRVWANRMPGIRFSMPSEITGYVISAGRPAIAVPVERRDGGWEFCDDYAALRVESGSLLPETLHQAIAQREFNRDTNWWAGIPELKTLFNRVSSSTVFESDEVDLLNCISNLLGSLLYVRPIQVREVPLMRYKNKVQQEMLRISDIDGAAGDSLVPEGEDEHEIDQDAAENAATRHEKLLRYREQNQRALALVGSAPRMLWVLGGTTDEQLLIRKSVVALFGEAIIVKTEPLPTRTHGLRNDLDLPNGTARQRFEQRVNRWQAFTPIIQQLSKDHQILAVICAPDTVGDRPEDQVNYYAGIHAFSAIGANVHHILPIEKPDDEKARQSFLHRTQSALLDVFLAHSGVVLNSYEFMSRLYASEIMPQRIYGIQAMRSRARRRSGETSVCFLLYSRLTVVTGITEFQVVYKDKRTNRYSDWMPLAKGLQWLGTQRNLHEGDENWLKDNFVDVTRDALLEIQQNDRYAVVMIDWDCVKGLWKGIRDEDLKSGVAKLGAIPLSTFGNLSFVRLRSGADTLSLREDSRTSYQGMKDGKPTGEILVDSYYTTGKNLVEITEERAPSPRVSHFIATMGYAKTVQIKRGFSCYRSMPRVKLLNKDLGEYEQITLDPGNMDASLPASMDITVLHAPADVPLEHIAKTVMGLRLGYAHYNDWTKLPAPLFFRRKIEDYIIRFPEFEEEEVTVTVIADEDESLENVASGAQLEMLFNEEELESLQCDPEPSLSTLEEQVLPKDDLEEKGVPPSVEIRGDLLSRARAAKVVCMFFRNKGNRPLYKRMFRDNPGEVQIHVSLPYWIKPTDLFGTYNATIRRMSSRIWDALRDLDYVRKVGISKPKNAELLNWLSNKLRIPQGVHGVLIVTTPIGGVEFQPFSKIIRDQFNNNLNEEDQIDTREVCDLENMRRLTRWASEHDHDEMMGWIIFTAAQMGFHDMSEVIFEEITHISGPKTEDALDYYITCYEVINEAMTASNHKRININRHRSVPLAAELEKAIVASPESEAFTVQEVDVSAIQQMQISHQQEERDQILAIKNKLIELIQHITPGAEDFDSGIAAISGVLEELAGMHRVAVEKQSTEALLRDRLEALKANCESLIADLILVKNDLELCDYCYVEPNESFLEAAIAQLDEIQALMGEFNALNAELEELSAMLPASSVMERARRHAKVGETLEAVMDISVKIKAKLAECICIVSAEDTTPPEDKEPLPELQTEEIKPTSIEVATSSDKVRASAIDIAESAVAANVETFDARIIKVEAAAVIQEPVVMEETLMMESAMLDESAQLVVVAQPKMEPLNENVVDEPEMDEYSDADFSEIDRSIGILNGLIKQRYYGLAEVHVEALKYLLREVQDINTSNHYTVLNALVSALYAMDCQFEFENSLDPDLQHLLESSDLPSGKLCEPHIAALGVLAASLASMLFASPEVRWSIGNAIGSRLQGYPALSGLIHHIDDVRRQGLIITRDMYLSSRIGEKSAIEVELARFKKRAEEWKNAPEIYHNWNHRGFRNLHNEIYSNRHSIGYCLSLIAKGDVDRVKSTFEEARRKLEKPAVTIDEVYKKLGERTQPVGLYRERAIENLEKTRHFIESYLEHVKRRENPSNELDRNVQHFLNGLHKRLNESVHEIASIEPQAHLECLYRDAAVVAINSALKLFENMPAALCIPQDKQKLLIQLPMGRDLMPILEPVDAKTPALVTPNEVFLETERWVNETLRMDGGNDSIDAAIKESMHMHVQNKRFIPAWHIGKLLNISESIIKNYNIEKTEFKARLQEAKQRVTHAMTLSALQQDEANSMLRIIDKMLSAVQTQYGIGHPDGEPATFADFPQAIAMLNYNVSNPLMAHLNEAAADLKKRLDDYAELYGHEASGDVKRIRNIIGDGNNAASLRTAFDAMAMLNANHRLPKRLGQPVDMATEYDKFMQKVHLDVGNEKRPLESLLDRLREVPHTDDPDWLVNMSKRDREDAIELISTWIDMFIEGNVRFDKQILTRVMHNIGISCAPDLIPESGRQTRVKFFMDERSFTFPNTNEDDVFIPPILGSWASHIEGFLIPGMKQENELRQAMIGIGGTPTLVLCRNHFNMQKRARICGNLPVLLIDDDLIAYVALHPSERLQNFMRVAILTFSTNPYDDYGGRPVPTEMFFGRQKELSKLRDVKSMGVLYGGRRLGKSSLLGKRSLNCVYPS
jgi:hypothetical protein